MKSLHKLGKYHNLDKLNKMVELICHTTPFSARARHNFVNNPLELFDAYSLWWTLGVEWHVDDIDEDKKYSIILVVESNKYELYASTVLNNTYLEKHLKVDCNTTFKRINNRIESFLQTKKDTQRLVLKTGDILLLNTSYYHKLENTRETDDPFIFISLDINFIPKIKDAVKVVNYLVHDFFTTINED